MIKWLFLLAAIFTIGASYAADDRIRTEIYDPDRVYPVYTVIGRATLIQFENGESLLTSPDSALGMGFADAWNLGVRGNNIVLKPSVKRPRTNLVVVTNKRTYSFDLLIAPQGIEPTYILKFRYLDSETAKALAETKRVQIIGVAQSRKITINTNYVWRGIGDLLKPTAAYDDGRFTYLIYDNAAELPVFFKVMPDGTEALLNSHVDPQHGQTIVLQEIIRTIRARLGDQVIEIINKAYKQSSFNEDKTGVRGAVRIDKDKTP